MGRWIGGGGSGTGVNPDDVGYDVILCAGQSNMTGQGEGKDGTYLDITSGRVWQYAGSGAYKGQIIQATDPLFHHDQAASVRIGHPLGFAREYVRTVPENRQVLLVPTAHSGTGFRSSSVASPPTGYSYVANAGCWDPNATDGGFNLFDNAVTSANTVLALNPSNRLVAILWLQGENDAAVAQATYAAWLDSVIDGFRAQISGATNVPFILGQMTRDAAGRVGNNVNAAHIDTPRRKLRTAFTYGPSSGLTVVGEDEHYNAAGQRIIAARTVASLARARANILSVAPLVPAAPALIQSGTTVSVAWAQVVGRVTDYNVRYSTNGGTSWTTLSRAQSIDVTAAITGLTLGATVTVAVRAVNEQGTSGWSTTTALALAQLPNAPTSLAAGTPNSGSVPLTWTAPATDGTHSAATSLLVQYRVTGAGSWTDFSTVTGTAVTVTGLVPSTGYDFRVLGINAAGQGTASSTATATTAAPSTLAADVGITPYGAWSLRKVITGYSGSVIKVRRSSDSTTQDIGLTGAGDLDTTALLAFCGAGDGFIDTFYDQGGTTARNMTQTTANKQAQIVASGVVLTQNGKPAALHSSTAASGYSNTAPGLYASGTGFTVLAVVAPSATAATRAIFSEGGTSQGRIGTYIGSTGGFTIGEFNDSGSSFGSASGGTAFATTALGQGSTVDTTTALSSYANGAQVGTGTSTRAGATVTLTRQAIGALFFSSVFSSSWGAGYIPEVVCFATALSTGQRQAGEGNQKAYYGTP